MTDLRKAAEMVFEAWDWDWSEPRNEALRKRMEALRQALNVDAVNMTQERVDETAKREHEPWPSVQCVCGGTIYFKYTPPISDYHEGWEEGFKAAKRGWVGLTDEEARDISFNLPIKWTGHLQGAASIYDFARAIEAKLKERNT